MAFTKKTWKDRIAEYPTRRRLTKSDGSTELVTVSREEGTVSQEGDAFSAANMNNLETRVKNAFDAVDSSLADGQISFSVVDGEPYIKVGADAPRPFKSGASPFVTFRPVRNIDGDWINHVVLFDGSSADIYIDKVTTSFTHQNSAFTIYCKNRQEGTLEFLESGSYYINSQGTSSDLTESNDKKVVDVTAGTIINWTIVGSLGYFVVVKVG